MQIPNQVTISSDEQYTQMCPLEVAGWWILRQGAHTGDWVLILGSDPTATLSVHVSMRLPIGINVMSGQLRMGNSLVGTSSFVNTMCTPFCSVTQTKCRLVLQWTVVDVM